MRRDVRAGIAGLFLLSLVLAACGDDGEDAGTTATTAAVLGGAGRTAYPLTITNCGSTETFAQAPRTVLTEGAPPMTALLVQLGLKDRIVKTTVFSTRSDIPGMTAELESLPRVVVENLGLSREEAIALKPDLIVGGQESYFQAKRGFALRSELHAAGIQAYAPAYFCANNVDNPTPEAVAARKNAGIEEHLQTIIELGRIFDVNDRAANLVAEIRQTIADTEAKVGSLPPKRVTFTDPSIADETKSGGAFYVYGGKVVDELLAATGGTNVWSDQEGFATITKEAATVRPADVVIFGLYEGSPNPQQVTAYVQATYPSWPAAASGSVVQVDSTVNLQITHPVNFTLLAQALHPEAFS